MLEHSYKRVDFKCYLEPFIFFFFFYLRILKKNISQVKICEFKFKI